MLFTLFYPTAYVESVFTLDYQRLWSLGYRGLIFDIDNTLVPHGADATGEIEALFRFLHTLGFRTLMLSNNSAVRIERFLRNIDSLYIEDAGKPCPGAYRRAVETLALRREEVLVIGDQVFTDILGANLSGLDSVLVKFIGHDTETAPGKRRKAEALILRFYQKSRFPRKRLEEVEHKERVTEYAVEQK